MREHPGTGGFRNPKSNSPDCLTIVLKLGTSSICDANTHRPIISNLSRVVETIVKLRGHGHRVILVTSGAVGVGMLRLDLQSPPPKELVKKQAIAAVGQGRLMSLYDDLFLHFQQPIAQILLTRNDVADETQYLNACNTLEELLRMGVVPIVNENDTISTVEIRFGDNDTLSAITAGMVHADYLFLMTDVDCVYTDNPRTNPDAKPIRIVQDIPRLRKDVVITAPGSAVGTGGMITKFVAAELATAAGVHTVICNGSTPEIVFDILESQSNLGSPSSDRIPLDNLPLFTQFLAKPTPMVDRKWWVLHGIHTAGTVVIGDEQDVQDITANKKSLSARAISRVEGHFVEHQGVHVVWEHVNPQTGEVEQQVVGKGLTNYSSNEISRIKGCHKSEIHNRLGYANSDCVIHRDYLAIVKN